MCLNETLRIMPSTRQSNQFCLNETVKLGGVTVPARQGMFILIYHLHNNPKEWIEPSKYVPERFDPDSKWSLTPSGNKRHPMSFTPFLGGKRVCIGKTFAESFGRIMVSMIVSQLEFEFVDPKYKNFYPMNSMITQPQTKVKVTIA